MAAKARLRRDSKTTLELVGPNGEGPHRLSFSYENTLKMRDICQQNGWRVLVEDKLKEWIKNETAKQEWKYEMIPLGTPLGEALANRSFQRDGIDFILKNKSVLVADEPGLGKTLQSISAVIQAGTTGSILVVAPKTAAYVTWPHEMQQWFDEVAPYDEWVILGGKMTKLERIRTMKRILTWDMGKKRIGPRQWVVVSPNYFRIKPEVDAKGNYKYDEHREKILKPVREAIPALLAVDWKAVIVDECHQTLSGATGDVKKQSAQRQGLGLLELSDDTLRIAVSGTPFRGKHENLWGTLNWLYPDQYKAYWTWIGQYFQVYVDPLTNQRIIGDPVDHKKLAYSLRNIMIRRTKKEVAKELEPKRYGGTHLIIPGSKKKGPIAVWLDMSGQQQKAYDSMVADAMAELEGGTLMANGILAEMIRMKQFANSYGFMGGNSEFFPTFPSNKFDWIVDFLEDRGIDGKGPGESKVVIASQFTKHVDLFVKRLEEKHGIPCFSLTGKTSADERVRLQEDFQRGRLENGEPSPDVFFLNTIAGGSSLTLDAADDLVLVDNTFNNDDQEQVENRIHRLNNLTHKVTIWNLASTNSIDENILRHTWKMDASIKQILDGERGVDFARLLFSGT